MHDRESVLDGRGVSPNGSSGSSTALADGVAAAERLTADQQAALSEVARDTWSFFATAVDPNTHLPLDYVDLSGKVTPGAYTSPTDVGVYLWSVVAAWDLGLIGRPEALSRLSATLATVDRLATWHGFLLRWYSTASAEPILGPGRKLSDRVIRPPYDGAFVSTVDNGWYAVGLIVTRQAFPELRSKATALLDAMDFGRLYDDRDQRTNPNAGQLYGGYVVGHGPTGFHYGILYSETRIAAYVGIGTGAVPGDVWWRTWRTPWPDQTWQGQRPRGDVATWIDPRSGREFSVFEGHYRYAGVSFVPSWGGSVFEGLMPTLVVPETTWGARNLGHNARSYTCAQISYARRALGYPVWGLSPCSTPDDTGRYEAYGARGLSVARKRSPYAVGAVTPHASFLALEVMPHEALQNVQTLLDRYDVYGPHGFFDAVNPRTGQVSHRYLALDQAMILAALDNALRDGSLQGYFARDLVGAAIRPYLAEEQFSSYAEDFAVSTPVGDR